MKYTIIIEKAEENYSAYCPDLPGCIATGRTEEETIQRMKEAIEFHIEGLQRRQIIHSMRSLAENSQKDTLALLEKQKSRGDVEDARA